MLSPTFYYHLCLETVDNVANTGVLYSKSP